MRELKICLLASLSALLTLVIMGDAGCVHAPPPPTIAHCPVALKTVPRPTLPPVAASELKSLSNSAYTRIVERERLLRTWGLAEQAVIEQNNRHAAECAASGGKP